MLPLRFPPSASAVTRGVTDIPFVLGNAFVAADPAEAERASGMDAAKVPPSLPRIAHPEWALKGHAYRMSARESKGYLRNVAHYAGERNKSRDISKLHLADLVHVHSPAVDSHYFMSGTSLHACLFPVALSVLPPSLPRWLPRNGVMMVRLVKAVAVGRAGRSRNAFAYSCAKDCAPCGPDQTVTRPSPLNFKFFVVRSQ